MLVGADRAGRVARPRGEGMDLWQALAVAALALCLALILSGLYRRSQSRLSIPLFGLVLCVILWSAGELVTASARDMLREQTGIALLYSGSIFLPSLWWMLVLRWAEERSSPPPFDARLWTRIPLSWATAMWLVMLTNPWHGQFLTPVIGAGNLYHVGWWAMAIPNYALILAALAIEVWVARRVHRREVRRQAGFLIAASLITLLANWVYVSMPEPRGAGYLAPLTLSTALLVFGIYREGLFGLLPVAFPAIAENAPDGLIVVRSDATLVHANPRAHELLAPVELSPEVRLPQALGELLRDRDGRAVKDAGPRWEAAWWSSVEAPEGELYCTVSDGARWLRLSAQIVRGRTGRIKGRSLRVRDVTEERRTEAELQRARSLESLAQLSRGVSREFKSLLAVVHGNADLLVGEVADAPKLRRCVEQIRRATRAATDLAGQLDLYAGVAEPRRIHLDLSRAVGEVAALLESDRGQRVDVKLDLPRAPIRVRADPVQMRQAVHNLLTNAREALGEDGGEIAVATGTEWIDPAQARGLVLGQERLEGEYAYVRISDTGHGMSAQVQERIFEPFFTTRRDRRGLGLAIVVGVVRAHGGLLGLRSRPGGGSVFTLFFAQSGEAGEGSPLGI